MRRTSLSLCLAGLSLAFLTACASTPAVSADSTACICGTHEAAIHGCHNQACISGEGNPDNPQCHCAPIKAVDDHADDGNGDS